MCMYAGLLAVASCVDEVERPPIAPAPRAARAVFIRAMLIEVPTSRVADVSAMSIAEIRSLPDVTIVTSPNLIAQPHDTSSYRMQGPGSDLGLVFTSDVLANGDVRLSVRVTGDAEANVSRVFHDAQTIVFPAKQSTANGNATLLVVRPELIHDDHDMRRISRTECSDCGLPTSDPDW